LKVPNEFIATNFFFGNTLLEYLAVIAGMLVTWILLRLTRRRLLVY